MKPIKVIFPVVALLLAISGALATGLTANNSLTTVQVSSNMIICDVVGSCSNQGGFTCKYNYFDLYEVRDPSLLCGLIPATGTFTPN